MKEKKKKKNEDVYFVSCQGMVQNCSGSAPRRLGFCSRTGAAAAAAGATATGAVSPVEVPSAGAEDDSTDGGSEELGRLAVGVRFFCFSYEKHTKQI